MRQPDFIKLHTMGWLAVAGLAAYLVLALFVPGEDLRDLSVNMNLGMATAVVVTWLSAALYAIKNKAIGRNQLILAVFTLFSVFMLVRAYNSIYNTLGQPENWPNDTVIGLFGYLIFLSGALFLSAPANVEKPDADYYRQLIWALLLGTVTGSAAYWIPTLVSWVWA